MKAEEELRKKKEEEEIINKKESNEIGDEMEADTDERIGGGNEKKEEAFLESLKRKLNKNINDLKGIVSDQNEEES